MISIIPVSFIEALITVVMLFAIEFDVPSLMVTVNVVVSVLPVATRFVVGEKVIALRIFCT